MLGSVADLVSACGVPFRSAEDSLWFAEVGSLLEICGDRVVDGSLWWFRRGSEAADCGVVGRDKALLHLEGANLCVEYCKKFY